MGDPTLHVDARLHLWWRGRLATDAMPQRDVQRSIRQVWERTEPRRVRQENHPLSQKRGETNETDHGDEVHE